MSNRVGSCFPLLMHRKIRSKSSERQVEGCGVEPDGEYSYEEWNEVVKIDTLVTSITSILIRGIEIKR